MPTHYSGTPRQELALNTFIKLTRAVDSVLERLSHRGTQGNLTHSQFGVLETLYHLGPLCQSALSQKLLLSTGNITTVIDNLEKRQLVRRERDLNDRRFVTVSLTTSGREIISSLLPGHVAAITDEMNSLTAEEQDLLGRLCRKLGKRENSSA